MLAAWIVAVAVIGASETAARRGNTVLTRNPAEPVYSVSVAGRVPILLGGGTGVIQPVGFGAGLQFRYHGLRIGSVRFGAVIGGGHIRIMERVNVTYTADDGAIRTARRYAALDQTSFALGPSFMAVLGPVVLEVSGGVGVGISSLVRPAGVTIDQEYQTDDVSAVVRADGHLGFPLRRNQGIVVGAYFENFFSGTRVVSNLSMVTDPDAEKDVAPFDMVLSPYLGYQAWF